MYLLANLLKLLILTRHLFTPSHTAYIEKNCVRFRCVVTNTRSVVNKLNELAVYVTINSVDIFGITETHLSIDLPDSLILKSAISGIS